jgi:hypothetical protein
MRRQQADAPNHYSSSNNSTYVLLRHCCSCNALSGLTLRRLRAQSLRVLRCATQFVTLPAVPPHSSRQLLCPSCHFVHCVLRSATLHLVPLLHNAHGQAIALQHTFISNQHSSIMTKSCSLTSLQILHPIAFALPYRSQASPITQHPGKGYWVPLRSTTAFIHFSSIQSTRCQ